MNETEEAIKQMKNGKAPGSDKITVEMIKYMGISGIRILNQIFNKAWVEEVIPTDWRIGVLVPIYKNKGCNKECKNYRGITLLSTVLKIYERILVKKLNPKIEPTLLDSQCGFRKGRSAQDHIFSIQEIINKTRDTKREAHLAFVDLETAFDKVQTRIIWESLHKRGVSSKLTSAIKSLYRNSENLVAYRSMKSESFPIHSGLRQGGVMSPTLFNIFMDELIRKCRPILKSYR